MSFLCDHIWKQSSSQKVNFWGLLVLYSIKLWISFSFRYFFRAVVKLFFSHFFVVSLNQRAQSLFPNYFFSGNVKKVVYQTEPSHSHRETLTRGKQSTQWWGGIYATYQKQTHTPLQWSENHHSNFTPQSSIVHLFTQMGGKERGKKKEIGKIVSAVIFGKLAVLFMRKSQGTNINYKLYSTIAFSIVGKLWNINYLRYWKTMENVRMLLKQLASLLVSFFQHHIKNMTSSFSSSFSHTHVSHP